MALTAEWPHVGGDLGHTRFSPLTDLTKENVDRLEIAWTYRHGDYSDGGLLPDRNLRATAFEATPIVVDGRLIFSTPFNRVIALDPETGDELWRFDSEIDRGRRFANQMISRGVAYWRGGRAEAPCARRVFLATLDARLIAVDAATGIPCSDFADGGEVNLLDGIAHVTDPWEYNVTSAPTVLGTRVIVGSSIADITRRVQPSGIVRAYDARTGSLVWTFNTIPPPGEVGHATWRGDSWRTAGGANVWSSISADRERGLVFLPVSSSGPDFYGGDRPGSNLFANSVVAVDVETGERVWHFQAVHHDIWDNDVGAPPLLIQTEVDGTRVDAVAVLTKTGFAYILNRETGEPIFPVDERPVPQQGVPGEKPSPTQPIPTAPPPLVPQSMGDGDLWATDPGTLEACRDRFAEMKNLGLFTPPGPRETLLYPGNGGGANWSGGAFDPKDRILFVPVTNVAHTIRLDPLPPSNVEDTDGVVLRTSWSALWWLLTGRGTGLRYRMIRRPFSEDGQYPCHAPPWGAMVAVDVDEGSILWRAPVGRDHRGIDGLPVAGPPLLTAGGLLFQGGTRDSRLQVFDSHTGQEITVFHLPAGLHSGPITYKLTPNGKQYLVVAPGGHAMLDSPLGDWIIAYALPRAES